MDIQKSIDELRFSLEHSLKEVELLGIISNKLTALRQTFSSNKALFTADNVEFLKKLTPISDGLRSFIELKPELSSVNGLKHYTFLMNHLVDIRNSLRAFAICKRVDKEIRELREKLAYVRLQDAAKQESQLNARILDLEQNPRHCSHKHQMAIREGRYGYFWGCSRYPMCQQTTQLTAVEKNALYSLGNMNLT
jgi:hypothetical protein